LFESERASSEVDGKAGVRSALGILSQTLALLQDVRSQHRGVEVATESLAKVMSTLFPLTAVPSKAPPPAAHAPTMAAIPSSAPVPHEARGSHMPPRPPATTSAKRIPVEANIGATTESNFYVGFSGEIAEGGVFLATYEALARDTFVDLLVTLPGGFEFRSNGWVRFVRDSLDFSSESEPGMGIQFEGLDPNARELVLRFIRKRPPMFYDV
jgi:uncharacterized protein (TIGR02266 family)